MSNGHLIIDEGFLELFFICIIFVEIMFCTCLYCVRISPFYPLTGTTAKEAFKINGSLKVLGDVIEAIKKNQSHVPFRYASNGDLVLHDTIFTQVNVFHSTSFTLTGILC